jgi:hypothetical protein
MYAEKPGMGVGLKTDGDITRKTPSFFCLLWLGIGFALSVGVVLEGLLLSIDSVFISV